MLAQKKKLGKKQIKEDKLVTYYSKALEYYDDNKNQVVIALGVVIAVIAAIVYLSSTAQTEDIEASAELAKVAPLFESGNYQAAIDGNPAGNIPSLQQVATKYSGTEQGELARLYLAHSYYFMGDYDNAMKNYDDYSGDNTLFKAAALAGKASIHEVREEYSKAAKLFKDAAYLYQNNPSNSQYLLNAAINYLKSKDFGDAKNLLEKIKEDYPNSPAAREVDRYLARVAMES